MEKQIRMMRRDNIRLENDKTDKAVLAVVMAAILWCWAVTRL